jgi:hypothetical protein
MSKMKRVLVTIPDNNNAAWRHCALAIENVLRVGYKVWPPYNAVVYIRELNKAGLWASRVVLRCESGWRPDFKNLPKQFVVELPEKFVRDGVPTYTGPIKGETPKQRLPWGDGPAPTIDNMPAMNEGNAFLRHCGVAVPTYNVKEMSHFETCKGAPGWGGDIEC